MRSGPRRYDAELGGWSGHAIFNNVLPGFIGTGYAAGLDDQDSAVSFAVDGPSGGKTLTLRYALDRGGSGAVTVTVQSGSQVDAGHSQRVALHGGAGAWTTQSTSVRLQAGRNLIIVTGTGRGSGVNLDHISLS